MNVQAKGEVEALLEAAREHRKRGDRAAALKAFQAASEADAGNRAIEVAVAAELRALDRLDEAGLVLRRVLEKEPGSIAALIEQGHLARRCADNAAALAAFASASALDPKHLGLKVEVARSLRALDRLDEAAAKLDQALQADPSFLAALIEQGHLRRKAGDNAGALASFEAAAAVDPAHVGIKLEIAACQRALDRTDAAEATLRGLVEAAPRHLPALVALGQLLIDTGRGGEAAAIFRTVQAIEPNDPRVPFALARIARLSDDRPAVLRHMRAIVAANPQNFEARRTLAAELRAQGDIAAAKAELHRLLEDAPDDAGSWVQLGLLYRLDRDRSKALAAFETAHRLRPQSAEPLVELARETWAAGDPAAAETRLAEALALKPDHTGALALAAEWALVAGRPDEALRRAEAAIAADPKQLGLRLLAARAAAALPDRPAAEKFLADARADFGGLPDLLATRIHILRSVHDYAGLRGLVAEAEGTASAAVWIEGVSAAIAIGDFERAARMIDKGPSTARRDRAWGAFLRGQLAAAGRDYAAAAAHYAAALELDPGNGGWEGELARAALLCLDTEAAALHLRRSVELNRSSVLSRRESLNSSQHHLGQLLNDFGLDASLLERLRRTLAGNAPERLAALRTIVRENPDSTAAALMLVLEMRRAGEFRHVARRFGRLMPGRIPRRIVQFWDSEAVPEDVAALMASWRDERGTFQYVVFNEASAGAYLMAKSTTEAARAFRRARHPAQRADVFRLAYLAREGGIYADADDRRVAPFDDLAPRDTAFVGYQEDYGTLGNNFLAAEPGHPVIRRALAMVVAAINRGDSDNIWLASGPGLLTRAFAVTAAEQDARAWLGRALVRELHEMQALVEIHCPAAYKRTERHWSNAAKPAGKPPRRRAQ